MRSELKTGFDNGLTLYGTKVLLRNFSEKDIDNIYIGWLNDPDVVRFSNQRFLKHDRNSSLQYLASFKSTENIFISIRLLPDEKSVGTMTAYVSKHHATVDVGILVGDKSAWGKGIGQDAWNTLMNWILDHDNIRKLTAGTLSCNYGMIKIIERSGMHCEAVHKKQEIVNTQAVDILYYAKFQ